MKHSEYYFGVDASHWAELPYKEALVKRMELAEAHLRDIMEIDYMNRDQMQVNKIKKAISEDTVRLKEINSSFTPLEE